VRIWYNPVLDLRFLQSVFETSYIESSKHQFTWWLIRCYIGQVSVSVISDNLLLEYFQVTLICGVAFLGVRPKVREMFFRVSRRGKKWTEFCLFFRLSCKQTCAQTVALLTRETCFVVCGSSKAKRAITSRGCQTSSVTDVLLPTLSNSMLVWKFISVSYFAFMSCSTLCYVDLTALFYLYQSLISQLHGIKPWPHVYGVSDSGGFLHVSRRDVEKGNVVRPSPKPQTGRISFLVFMSHWDKLSHLHIYVVDSARSRERCFSEWEMFQTEVAETIKTNIMFSNFYPPVVSFMIYGHSNQLSEARTANHCHHANKNQQQRIASQDTNAYSIVAGCTGR